MNMKRRGLRPVDVFDYLNSVRLPIRYDTVLSWFDGVRDPRRRLNLVKNLGGNFVELVGLLLGDGNWKRIERDGSYMKGRITYGSKDLELATWAGTLMAKTLGKRLPYRPYWAQRAGVYLVECGSKHLVEILPSVLYDFRDSMVRFKVRFLKGIYDAEGSITIRIRRNRIYPRVFLSNSDSHILQITREMLSSLGIKTTIEMNTHAGKQKVILGTRTTTRVDVYNVCIGTIEGVLRFARLVGFRIPWKQEILETVCCHLLTDNRN